MNKNIEKIGNIFDYKKGYAFKSSDYKESGTPIIRVTDFTQDSISDLKNIYIDSDSADSYKSYELLENDIIIQTVGSWANNINSVVGKVIRVPRKFNKSLLNQNAVRLRVKEGYSQDYLYYLLKSDMFFKYIINHAQGAANQPQIPIRDLKRIPLFIPSLKIQEKIAGILSAYDELIENNKKRIALLETMAEELYKEWFVRFRFPNYENTEFEKGVPSNWEETTLKYIANVTMGQSPSSEFYNDAGVGLPFHQGVGTYGERFPINSTFCSVEGRLAQENDILFSVRAPVGRLNIATTQSIIGRGLCAINSKNGQSDYLFYLLNHTFSKEDIIGNGAIFNSVSKDELLGFKLLKPNDEIVEAFNNQAKTINEAIRNLYDKNENLTEQKNKLLPKLISGKLSVKHLDIQQPPTSAQPTDKE